MVLWEPLLKQSFDCSGFMKATTKLTKNLKDPNENYR